MAGLTLRNITKQYENGFQAVSDFNLEIKDKEFIIFVGPSGCGKSTTLRMIAGLEEISDGELWIGSDLVNYRESKDRDLSMVFQNYALYPNMTVYDNIAFSLQVRKVPKKEIDKKVHEAAKILEIEHLLDRKATDLSGGQKQRVAIGNAIIRKPNALLMDEPLSNLDARLRAKMRVELAQLHKRLQTTIIYVTHDQTEAMTLGDRIVVMNKGKIQQVDTPAMLYEHPDNQFVAGFIGSPAMNFLRADVKHNEEIYSVTLEGKTVSFGKMSGYKAWILKKKYMIREVVMGIRPEHIYTEDVYEKMEEKENLSLIPVTIEAKELLGAETILYFRVEGERYCSRAAADCQIEAGDQVNLAFDLNQAHFFDSESGINIVHKYQ
ncbi:MAG: sn-glycerol-3-phosphate ABC transporter ATP-binding protein UgpC [Lachnospiraceae bacterium]|nr:sn-glycerol-3-phosphate ABC transporter ATP-binding protein UgpC [Lachnospiraceae bacterium]